jgi:hypothetical protein
MDPGAISDVVCDVGTVVFEIRWLVLFNLAADAESRPKCFAGMLAIIGLFGTLQHESFLGRVHKPTDVVSNDSAVYSLATQSAFASNTCSQFLIRVCRPHDDVTEYGVSCAISTAAHSTQPPATISSLRRQQAFSAALTSGAIEPLAYAVTAAGDWNAWSTSLPPEPATGASEAGPLLLE